MKKCKLIFILLVIINGNNCDNNDDSLFFKISKKRIQFQNISIEINADTSKKKFFNLRNFFDKNYPKSFK